MITIKKYPINLQDEEKNCGVSCISMIIEFYGGFVKKTKLMELTKTTRKGTTAFNIKETLEELGFSAKGVKCDLKDIREDNIVLPCIANVTINNSYKHFIVIYEINFTKKYLIVGDPADKIKKISFNDFEKIFNNVLIICYPITSMPFDKKISFNNIIFELVAPYKKYLLNILILSTFITIFSILTSFYTEYMINSLSIYSNKYLFVIFYIFFLIYIIKIISNYFRNKLLIIVNEKMDLVFTLDVFNKIVELPYNYYQNRTVGDMVSRINDLDKIKDLLGKMFISIFVDFPLTLVALVVLLIINRTLFLVGIFILAFYILIIILFRRRVDNYLKVAHIRKGEAMSCMVESISGYDTIKGIHIEDDIKDKFEKKYVKLLSIMFKYQNLYSLQNLLKEIIDNIGFIIITLIGCILVSKGEMTIGSLLTFSALLVYFLEPIKSIINLDIHIKQAKISFERIIDTITYDNIDNGIIDKVKKGNIEFKNLDYSFDNKNYVLKNINLKINNGSKTMAVGKSGSGKSTLFKLLLKFYNVNKGKIFIDDIDINNYNRDAISNSIIYVSQNEILFNDTLYNNLNFDSNSLSNLLNISKLCCIDKIIDSNLGFNMLIEENGSNLSGGERQRVILARALLKHFDTIILDESLSQVDIDMERIILKRILTKFKDKTIIFISHRLDNLDLFDNLIRFENGVVYNEKRNG